MSEENDNKPENDPQLAAKIKDSARQIWLAGLGAYTKAEEDTGRFFDRLVQEGEQLENRTRGVVEKRIKSVEDRVEGFVSVRPVPGTGWSICLTSGCPGPSGGWVFTAGKRLSHWSAVLRRSNRNWPACAIEPVVMKRNSASAQR